MNIKINSLLSILFFIMLLNYCFANLNSMNSRLILREKGLMCIKRWLQVSWNGVDLENTDTPKLLGVTLDRTLSYKIHNTMRMKVATRNNLLKK